MSYHFGVPGFQGGFFGLDIFYVLSGYLITGLLLGEWARAARINLVAFWGRRARRLLPALLILLVTVTVVIHFTNSSASYPNLRMTDLSALFYFSNWWQIATSGNYFASTGPVSPLTHTWSLAVEEQFYLIWPFLVLAVLHLGRRFNRGLELLLGISVIGAIASAVEMSDLFGSGASSTRLYFGTDTHAQSLMVGAALACALTLIQRRRGLVGMAPLASSRPVRALLTLVGLAGASGTLLLTSRMSGASPAAFQGGFLLSAISAAALIIGAVCVAGGPIAWVLSLRPVVWVGTVSYGAYLWHFPVSIELDTKTGVRGFALLALRTVFTFALAGLSYYFIERPVMRGTFWRSIRSTVPAVAAVGLTVAVVMTLGTSVAVAGLPSTPGAENRLGSTKGTEPVLVVGDSLALTLGFGLVSWSVDSHDGLRILDEGLAGCGVAEGRYYIAAGARVAVDSWCNTATPASGQWPAIFAGNLARYHPKTVIFLAGRWEVFDWLGADGQLTNIEDPDFADYIRRQIQLVVTLATNAGSHVVLLTAPYFQSGEQPDGQPLPEDQPRRVDIYNRLVAEVAASNAHSTELVDLHALVSPGGHFASSTDGVTIRAPDGVHFPFYNVFDPNNDSPETESEVDRFARWLGPKIFPSLDGEMSRTGPAGSP